MNAREVGSPKGQGILHGWLALRVVISCRNLVVLCVVGTARVDALMVCQGIGARVLAPPPPGTGTTWKTNTSVVMAWKIIILASKKTYQYLSELCNEQHILNMVKYITLYLR